jgi:hypothetical protein
MKLGRFVLAMLLGSTLTLIATGFFSNRARADQKEPPAQRPWEVVQSPDVAFATSPFEAKPGVVVDDRNTIAFPAEGAMPNRTSDGNLVLNLGVAEYSMPYAKQQKTVMILKISHRVVMSQHAAEQVDAVLRQMINQTPTKKPATTEPSGGGL